MKSKLNQLTNKDMYLVANKTEVLTETDVFGNKKIGSSDGRQAFVKANETEVLTGNRRTLQREQLIETKYALLFPTLI